MKRKRVLIFASVGVFVLALFAGGYFFIKSAQELPTCPTGAIFAHRSVNPEDIDSIIPLGNLNPSGHTFPTDHIYYNFAEGKTNIPVYMPGTARITNISKMTKFSDGETSKTDWSVNFSPCEDVSAYYIHINSLAPKLEEAFMAEYEPEYCEKYQTGGDTFEDCFVETNLNMEAGEVVGYTADPGQHNFDLGVNDQRLPIPWFVAEFSNVERMERAYSTACPLDYFIDEIKEEQYAMLGDMGQKRSGEPLCGTLRQDVWGTAQGYWFAEDSVGPMASEDKNLALVHDVVDFSIGAFSVGTALEDKGLPSSKYLFTPRSSGFVNRDFDQVKPDGNRYCYVANGGYDGQHQDTGILLELLNPKTVRLGKLAGDSCDGDPADWKYQNGYVDFIR